MLRVRGSVLVARMRHIVDQVLQRAESMSQDARITTVSDLPAVHIDRRPSTSVPREQFSSKYLVEVMDDKWRSDDFQPSSLQSADRMAIISQVISLSSRKERVLSPILRMIERAVRPTF